MSYYINPYCIENTPLIYPVFIPYTDQNMAREINGIKCLVESIADAQSNSNKELKTIRQSVTTDLPIVAKVEYPSEQDNMLIYKWIGYTFRDWVLGPLNIYFSGRIDSNLPVYIQDDSGYNHIVTEQGNPDVQLNGVSEELANTLLPATYDGNYIHLT